MTVRIEKSGPVWTVIHSRSDARNAMDPASADALVAAFQSFDSDSAANARPDVCRSSARVARPQGARDGMADQHRRDSGGDQRSGSLQCGKGAPRRLRRHPL